MQDTAETNDRSTRNEPAIDQYLSFRLAEEDYAVPILQVQEIIDLTKPTAIPNTPPHVLGVINLRGTVVPVLDLRQKFGMEPTERTRTTVNLVVNVGSKTIGLVVDAVSDVVDLDREQLQDPPEFDQTVDVRCLRGVANVDGRMMLVLDLAQIVDFEAESKTETSSAES